jgi:hypothetical protein
MVTTGGLVGYAKDDREAIRDSCVLTCRRLNEFDAGSPHCPSTPRPQRRAGKRDDLWRGSIASTLYDVCGSRGYCGREPLLLTRGTILYTRTHDACEPAILTRASLTVPYIVVKEANHARVSSTVVGPPPTRQILSNFPPPRLALSRSSHKAAPHIHPQQSICPQLPVAKRSRDLCQTIR